MLNFSPYDACYKRNLEFSNSRSYSSGSTKRGFPLTAKSSRTKENKREIFKSTRSLVKRRQPTSYFPTFYTSLIVHGHSWPVECVLRLRTVRDRQSSLATEENRKRRFCVSEDREDKRISVLLSAGLIMLMLIRLVGGHGCHKYKVLADWSKALCLCL